MSPIPPPTFPRPSPITTMISRIYQPLLRTHLQTHSLHSIWGIRRPFSVPAIYSSFPATLLRYNSRQRSSLYDRSKRHEREDDPNWDGIEISEDGLVHPGASKEPACLYSIFQSVSEPNPDRLCSIQRGNADAKHLHNAREHPN